MPGSKVEDEKRYVWDPFQVFKDNWPALHSLSRRAHELQAVFAPDVEVRERDRDYIILLDVPGVRARDIDVTVEDHCLTVTGKRRTTANEQGERYIAYERRYGAFSRTFSLPPEAATRTIRAELEDGVLAILVPKADAEKGKPSLTERVRRMFTRRRARSS